MLTGGGSAWALGQSNTLFGHIVHGGVRAVISGQVGRGQEALHRAGGRDRPRARQGVLVCHVGDMMYAEAPDVVPGRILDLPRPRLDLLRRSVFKDILRLAEKADNLLVNTHATFRWRHGLFPAFDHDQMVDLDADLYITLVDNVDAVHERLTREHDVAHTLKDILVWREEEILATEVMARIIRGHGRFFVIARGDRAGHGRERLPADVRAAPAQGLPVVPHDPRDGHAARAGRDRRLPRHPGRALHHLRPRRPGREAAAVRGRRGRQAGREELQASSPTTGGWSSPWTR